MQAWSAVEVSEQDFFLLKDHNRPITSTDFYEAFYPNEGVEVRSCGRKLNTIFDVKVGLRKINDYNPQFATSRNRDLAILNDMMNNEDVDTIIVDGLFGTGKTSNIMAHVVDYLKNSKNPHVIISKPHVGVGKSYGHLPGDLNEKIQHEFKSFYQYIDRYWQEGMSELLLGKDELSKTSMAYKEVAGIKLETLPFEYIRGLDIDNAMVILDETQNTDKQEVVSFVSRLNKNVKFVALGDTHPAQIDRKSVVNPKQNGFAFLKETYKDKPYSGVAELTSRNHILRGDRVKHLFDALELESKKEVTN